MVAQRLRELLTREPDNGDAVRQLAQTLYWLQDVEEARRLYEAAMIRHPEDYTLRLQYARMLVETGDASRARVVLTSLQSAPEARADAESLLGVLSYWAGNLRDATRRFERAIQLDPRQTDAATYLREIRTATAPWVRASTSLMHDSQPLDRLGLGLEAGWFPTVATSLTARVQPAQFRIDGRVQKADTVEVEATHVGAAARLEAIVAGGGVRRSYGAELWDWTGRASIGLRFSRHATVRAQFARVPYTSTTASLATPVMVRTWSGSVHWGHNIEGWLGELAWTHQRYPDNNVERTGYGWTLVPVVRRDAVVMQIGYGFSSSHADQNRFGLDGRYVPYFTPTHLQRHSLLGALTVGPGRPATIRIDASYGVRATDDAPTFIPVGSQLVPAFYPRTSTPWTVRAAAALRVRDTVTLEPKAEFGRTVFYSWSTAAVYLTYRRAPKSRPR